MSTGAHFEIFPERNDAGEETGEYAFRLRAANGEIVAQSESYGSRDDAERGARACASAAREASNARNLNEAAGLLNVQQVET